ncbi:hypothetical protein ACFVU0_19970 [Streptomyces sp. NPDC058122]|uniref:hypothetical protein n=1 Tax=Streptomyces sp. NPDC058122 TaxID=3346349 RepID=UPI0036E37CA4
MTSTSTEVEPAPVFVDQTGQRGRRLRGLGWLVGILCAGCVVAMISGLVGTQSQAPALTIPGTANTTPPSQYLNAPLPAAPGVEPGTSTTATATEATATPTVTTPDATASATATADTGTADTGTADAGTTASSPVTDPTRSSSVTGPGQADTPDTTASVAATTTAGTTASDSVTDAAQ